MHKESMTRRELLQVFAGVTAALGMSCSPKPSFPSVEIFPNQKSPTNVTTDITFDYGSNLFPEGQSLTKDSFNQDMYQRLMEAWSNFPEVPVHLNTSPVTQVDLTETLTERADIIDRSKIHGISFVRTTNSQFGVGLRFENGVTIGQEFDNSESWNPAIIFTSKENKVTTVGADQAYIFSMGQDDDNIDYMNLPFPVEYTTIAGSDLMLIFNKGLFSHQPQRAVFLPIKFKILESKGNI